MTIIPNAHTTPWRTSTHSMANGQCVQARDTGAITGHLTELYRQHAARVLQIVAASLRQEDRHTAEDIAQDVWVMYWQTLLRGTVITSPAGLLATMARRRVYDHYRSAKIRRETPVSDMTIYAAVAVAA